MSQFPFFRVIRFGAALVMGAAFSVHAQGRQSPAFPIPPVPNVPGVVSGAPSQQEARPQLFSAPRLPMQTGDILIEGVVQGVSFVRHEFTLLATSFTLPDGRRGKITAPKLKTIKFEGDQFVAAAPYPTDGSAPQRSAVGSIWPTYRVAVVGRDSGTGQVMTARLIELGGQGSISWSNQKNANTPGRTIFFGGAREHVAATGLRVNQIFGLKNIQAKAGQDGAREEHQQGLALDFIVGNSTNLGNGIAAFLEANAGRENIKYILWKDHLVYPGSRTEWSALARGQGSLRTAGQIDHVHVSFLEHPIVPGPYLTDELLRRAPLTRVRPASRRGRR